MYICIYIYIYKCIYVYIYIQYICKWLKNESNFSFVRTVGYSFNLSRLSKNLNRLQEGPRVLAKEKFDASLTIHVSLCTLLFMCPNKLVLYIYIFNRER